MSSAPSIETPVPSLAGRVWLVATVTALLAALGCLALPRFQPSIIVAVCVFAILWGGSVGYALFVRPRRVAKAAAKVYPSAVDDGEKAYASAAVALALLRFTLRIPAAAWVFVTCFRYACYVGAASALFYFARVSVHELAANGTNARLAAFANGLTEFHARDWLVSLFGVAGLGYGALQRFQVCRNEQRDSKLEPLDVPHPQSHSGTTLSKE